MIVPEWEFICEKFDGDASAHTWTETEKEPGVEPISKCPDCSLEPVQAMRWVPEDRAAFFMMPAALRLGQSTVRHDGMYFLEVLDPTSHRVLARSRDPIALAPAGDLIRELSSTSIAQTLQRARRMSFDLIPDT